MSQWNVFISHASEDKEAVARPLAEGLKKADVDVWLDEYELQVGDSLRRKIEQGLAGSRYGIVILSPDFFRKGWTQIELDALINMQISGRTRILPIWHRVDRADVERYSVLLVGNMAANMADGLEVVVQKILKVLKEEAKVVDPQPQDPPSDTPKVSLSLPYTRGPLVGREDELQCLDAAWETPSTHVIVLEGFGGAGKSSVVKHWLDHLAQERYRGAKCVFGWSFYRQGTRPQTASTDEFMGEALHWFGIADPGLRSPRERGRRLAELVQQQRTLLVLDALEPLQYPVTASDDEPGRIKDPAMEVLVRQLAAKNPGLCVITTRWSVADLDYARDGTASVVDVAPLPDPIGAELLRQLGVNGTDDELQRASNQVQGHTLTLNLLGNYLRKAHGGDIRAFFDWPIPVDESVDAYAKHANQVIKAYEVLLSEGPELVLLYLMGLFNGAVDRQALARLCAEPPIPSLTEALMGQSEDQWRISIFNLRECGLLADHNPGEPETLNAHPLVRQYFARRLQERFPAAWCAGHYRLYEHFKDSAPEFPETLEDMRLLFAAVVHGCYAEHHQEVFEEVYWRRIHREFAHFAGNTLGAWGADAAAVSCFFRAERARDQPVDTLTPLQQAHVMNEVAFDMHALGRLREAEQPFRRSSEEAHRIKEFKLAAIASGNLSQLHLVRGHVEDAVGDAQQSVRLADRSGDEFWRIAIRTWYADALHQAGQLKKANRVFHKAEAMQSTREPQHPLLHSFEGFRYCALLLSMGEDKAHAAGQSDQLRNRHHVLSWLRKVHDRALQTLAWVEERTLESALDHLTLGRALFLEALYRNETDFQPASNHLDQAVEGLRKAARQDFLLPGLLAHAAVMRERRELTAAAADLEEAEDIVHKCQMELYRADCALERSRLHWAKFSVDRDPDDREKARENLESAKDTVKGMGYHRLDRQVKELEVLVGSQ